MTAHFGSISSRSREAAVASLSSPVTAVFYKDCVYLCVGALRRPTLPFNVLVPQLLP